MREQEMAQQYDAQTWVYVMVQNPDKDDQIVGQVDAENNISFIPMFTDKESATQGMIHMAKERGKKYEIQAIMFEDLEKYAAESQFLIFVLDDEGKVIDKRAPFQTSGQ